MVNYRYFNRWFICFKSVNLNFYIGTFLNKPQNIIVKREKKLNPVDNFCLFKILYHIKDKNIDISIMSRKLQDLKFNESLKIRKTAIRVHYQIIGEGKNKNMPHKISVTNLVVYVYIYIYIYIYIFVCVCIYIWSIDVIIVYVQFYNLFQHKIPAYFPCC